MEEIKFHTITELYRRLYPALLIKKDDINRKYNSSIKELDVWNYFKNNIWNKSQNLALCDMVDNILNEDEEKIYNFTKEVKQGN